MRCKLGECIRLVLCREDRELIAACIYKGFICDAEQALRWALLFKAGYTIEAILESQENIRAELRRALYD